MDMTSVLPMECVSHIISLTSPRDACRLLAVSPAIRSAANSDAVWEKFLPSDYQEILSNSASSSSSLLTSLSKKELYFHLCRNPVPINNGTMSFALEKENGKKIYMIGARGLSIAWGDEPSYWIWISLPESRFAEVAELKLVWWFDVKGRIETNILSSKTTYAAYLVFKFAESRHGFERRPVALGVYIEGSDNQERRTAFLNPPANMGRLTDQDRGDGWMEIEMGEFFNENGDDGTLVCSVFDFSRYHTKRGIIIQGIELRPKNNR
ncbi:F-box protein [Melia azedarach]|uniref:F-box protein n=1 Tax=Melia azedarach TaxID=155640 RepID=A0ACC1YHR4_MELAZ|nr:F-box protein [Melia azedarach]